MHSMYYTNNNNMYRVKIIPNGFILSSFFTLLLFSACVNEVDSELSPGTIPINFKTKVSKPVTRVTDAAFEEGDKVGLYAMLSGTPVSGQRYIDNLWLSCGKNSKFITEKPVFYPTGDATLDFISYYPYQAAKIPEKKATINVSVQADQSTNANRSLSDFLIATKTNVKSSDEAVELNFKHKFTKLKITLTPKEGESAQNMKNANPRIIATGFHVKATYNMGTDTFDNWSETADILPSGEWVIDKDGNLAGKEFILIPQEVNTANQSFVMEWNGKIYTCQMPEFTMEENKQCQINIASMQTTSNSFTGIIGTIEPWGTVENKDTDNSGSITAIHLAALSFSQSNVYRIYHAGKPVVEVCKEYLSSEKVTSRAIVAYPVKANEDSDLSRGVVLQLLDKSPVTNSGTISWNTANNTATYTEGSSSFVDKFYLNEQGEILLEKPEQPISVDIISHTIKDIRKDVIYEYPVVKIGTQYWMRKDLCAITYTDGTPLTKKTTLNQGAAYYKPDDYEIYFYNGEAVLAGDLAPEGWRIPTAADWETLQTYINDNASLLKAGEWQVSEEGKPVCEVSNLTGFAVYPVGMWSNKHALKYQLNGFWTLDEDGTSIPQTTVFFMGSSNKIESGSTSPINQPFYKALSIRCLKD